MSSNAVVVITPAGMITRLIWEAYGPDPVEYFLNAKYSVKIIKGHPVAFSIEGEPGKFNPVASKWKGKPFSGTLIVLDKDGKPFPGLDEAWKVIDEIRSIYFNEVPNAGN